jgi:hypothetical protein
MQAALSLRLRLSLHFRAAVSCDRAADSAWRSRIGKIRRQILDSRLVQPPRIPRAGHGMPCPYEDAWLRLLDGKMPFG